MREMNAEDVMVVLQDALQRYYDANRGYDECGCQPHSSPCVHCQAEYALELSRRYMRKSEDDYRELPCFDLENDEDDYVVVEPDPE